MDDDRHAWFVICEGRDIVVFDKAPDSPWFEIPLVAGGALGTRRVEAITIWYCDGTALIDEGPQIAMVEVDVQTGARRLLFAARERQGWRRVGDLRLSGRQPKILRTLGFSGADSSDGGDIVWHADTSDGHGRTLMLSRTGLDTWTIKDLTGPAGIGVPVIRKGRMQMFRVPAWIYTGAYRQHVFLGTDEGTLGRIWWRDGWNFQLLPVIGDPCDPEGNSRKIRHGVPPFYLFDGSNDGDEAWPSGSLNFIGDDDTIWSAFPSDEGESLLHRGMDDGVALRSVSGASGMPIGWEYVPHGMAHAMWPGEHPGGICEGSWENSAAEGLSERLATICGRAGCRCSDSSTVSVATTSPPTNPRQSASRSRQTVADRDRSVGTDSEAAPRSVSSREIRQVSRKRGTTTVCTASTPGPRTKSHGGRSQTRPPKECAACESSRDGESPIEPGKPAVLFGRPIGDPRSTRPRHVPGRASDRITQGP